jgi:subtilisin family serine protease
MKKLLVTAILALFITTSASAATFKSYYDYATSLNTGLQISFSTSMIANYERSNKTYKSLIDRFGHIFGHYGWFQNMEQRYAFQINELNKFQSLLDTNNEKVTLVSTDYKVTEGVIVTRGVTEITESTVIVEENNGSTIKEFAVVTKIYSTPVKKQHWENNQEIKTYSDGTKGVTNNTSTTGITNTVETEEKVERELIREYAILIIDDDKDTDTITILTEAEYLARTDVSLYDTDTYREAVWKMNSRINEWYTTEVLSKNYGNHLELVGAPTAWSRGYTGEGSTVAILDTGIDVDHAEFTDSILDTKCFTRSCEKGYESINDLNRYSHGTHVAGIVGANLDGEGTTGVAYDADLLIAKTAYDSGYFDFSVADEAIAWAVGNGADVINISANYNFDNTYINSLVEITPGVYESTDTRGRKGITYDKYGYAGLLDSKHYYKNIVESMKGHEAVLVLAAGNQGADVAGQPGFIALNSEVGDRVLIVGNYDNRKENIARSSNKAGTVCYDVATDGTCKNTRLISDRYLLAPGQYVASTSNDGEYITNSGTSMATPIVSGAVAIVHQMWPHMTGENLSKLLLNTASKDITNYDVNVHGQGLLDLDEATLPQGAIGLVTTGRIDGHRVDVTKSGTIALNGGGHISALNSMMVVDDYDRDYYFDANRTIQVNDTRTASPTSSAMHGFTPDYYIGYNGGSIIPLTNAGTHIAVNDNNNNISIVQQWNKLTVGLVNEQDSFLGNFADSELMRVNNSNTAYLGYTDSIDLYNGVNVFGSATLGATRLNVDNTSMLKSADTMMSNSATLGVKQTEGGTTFGFVVSMPVSITSGSANFSIPNSVSIDGDVSNIDIDSSLKADRREIDLGLFYINRITNTSTLTANVEMRNNYAGIDETNVTAGITYRLTF